MTITYHKKPRQSQYLDYAANIYKNGKFVTCIRYEGYSGYAMHDEVKWLKQFEYPKSEGYTIEW